MAINYFKFDEIDKNLYDDVLVFNKKKDDYEIIKEKKKVYVANVDGKEITVTYNLSSKMNGFFTAYKTAILGSSSNTYFDPQSVSTLAEKEGSKSYEERKVYENCGEFIYDPYTSVMPGAKELTSEQVGNRALLFAKLCQLAANDSILQIIAEKAEKKKNGFLHKGRVIRIACVFAVDSSLHYYELYGQAKDDTNLIISVRENRLNYKNFDHMYNSLSSQINFFNPTEQEISNVPHVTDSVSCSNKTNKSTNKEKNQVDAKEAKLLEIDAKAWLSKYRKYLEIEPVIDFNGKNFVFSGLALHSKEKEHPIVKKVIEKGGQYRSKVSGLTNYLVVNPSKAGGSKIEDALDYREDGKDIKIILLEDLEKNL